jgi:hypothetical protein
MKTTKLRFRGQFGIGGTAKRPTLIFKTRDFTVTVASSSGRQGKYLCRQLLSALYGAIEDQRLAGQALRGLREEVGG